MHRTNLSLERFCWYMSMWSLGYVLVFILCHIFSKVIVIGEMCSTTKLLFQQSIPWYRWALTHFNFVHEVEQKVGVEPLPCGGSYLASLVLIHLPSSFNGWPRYEGSAWWLLKGTCMQQVWDKSILGQSFFWQWNPQNWYKMWLANVLNRLVTTPSHTNLHLIFLAGKICLKWWCIKQKCSSLPHFRSK